MIAVDFRPSFELNRQEIHDIRDMAQGGCNWEELQRHLNRPMPDLRRLVLATLPKCYVFYEAASVGVQETDEPLGEVA